MKSITILLSALAIGLLPATLGAQTATNDKVQIEPVNYYAEFADLMHGEMDAEPAPVAAPSANRFPVFVHFREVMQGSTEDFLVYYETKMSQSVPAAEALFANWTGGFTALTHRPVEDCSGR